MKTQGRNGLLYILISGFTIAFVGALLFLWIFFSSMRAMHQTTRDLYEHPYAVTNAALQLKASLYQIRSSLLFATLSQFKGPALQETVQFIHAQESLIEQDIHVMESTYSGDQAQIAALRHEMQALYQIRAVVLEKLAAGHYVEADQLIENGGSQKFRELTQLTESVLEFAKHRANAYVSESQKQLQNHTRKGLMYATLLLTLFLIVSVVLVWRMYRLHAEVDKFAFTDFLTGIANRRRFMFELESEVRRSQRYGSPFSFAMVDIDHFKKINDRYGHLVGDLVLQNFCLKCVSALRTSDMVGRLGGEEFGILMPMTDLHEAARVIERLRSEIDHSVVTENGQQIHYTASFGLVASSHHHLDLSLSQMMKSADAALYHAKQQGRNRVYIGNGAP